VALGAGDKCANDLPTAIYATTALFSPASFSRFLWTAIKCSTDQNLLSPKLNDKSSNSLAGKLHPLIYLIIE